MKIGICGMGRMGSAIARRLIDCGHTLTVWNRDAAKSAALQGDGAKLAKTPAELASGNELIITMLLNADALQAVYNGPDGVLSANVQDKYVIDMSTVLPETAEQLNKDVTAKGARFVECPVGGTVGPARDGKLLGLVGGQDIDVANVRPVLEQLCRRIEHVGPAGSGAKLKLAVNLPLMVYWQALGEALTLAKPLNLDAARLIDILSDTSGTPTAMKGRGPDIARLLAGQPTPLPAFEISAARKDLATMVTFAQQLGTSLPLTAAALACFKAAEAQGYAHSDPINIPVLVASGALKNSAGGGQ
jgi:3-hydroxyisobutyrate dehydrogenase